MKSRVTRPGRSGAEKQIAAFMKKIKAPQKKKRPASSKGK